MAADNDAGAVSDLHPGRGAVRDTLLWRWCLTVTVPTCYFIQEIGRRGSASPPRQGQRRHDLPAVRPRWWGRLLGSLTSSGLELPDPRHRVRRLIALDAADSGRCRPSAGRAAYAAAALRCAAGRTTGSYGVWEAPAFDGTHALPASNARLGRAWPSPIPPRPPCTAPGRAEPARPCGLLGAGLHGHRHRRDHHRALAASSSTTEHLLAGKKLRFEQDLEVRA